MSKVTTYAEISVAPYDLYQLNDLRIVNHFNDHATLEFTGIVPEDVKEQYIETTGEDFSVSIYQSKENGENRDLFHGLVQFVEVSSQGELYEIKVKAVSHSFKLDTERVDQTFQDIHMSYDNLIETVIEGKAMYLDKVSNGKVIGNPILQYMETDWQFLKRMASRFGTGLVPASTFSVPKFYFGAPSVNSRGELVAKNYTVRKCFDKYYECKPWIEDIHQNDFTYYDVISDEIYEIGDSVIFNNRSLVVMGTRIEMVRGILENHYILAPKQGMSKPKLFNMNIVGASLQGKVIGVKKDKIQVHFDMDKEQNPAKAHWWPYSTIYASEGSMGWHCMPEQGDCVRIYYPSYREEEAIAISSVQKE